MKESSKLRDRRVLAWPRALGVDSYYLRLSEGLDSLGWKVYDFTYRQGLQRSYAIIHIHVGTFPFRNKRKSIALARMVVAVFILSTARWRGAKIVWSLHNLSGHEQYHPSMETPYLNWLSRTTSLSVHMSEAARRAAFERFPALVHRPSIVIPLMHYGDTYKGKPTFSEARQILGLDPNLGVILTLGQIRRYKNIPELMRAFSKLPDRDVRLIIVGNPQDKSLVEEIRHLASDPRIILSLQTASVEEVELYMAASSLVVAPYRAILNSGSALLALAHRRPILLPNLGAMVDLQSTIGRDWVRLYQPPLDVRVLATALEWSALPRAPEPNLSPYEPDRIIEAHSIAFENLVV